MNENKYNYIHLETSPKHSFTQFVLSLCDMYKMQMELYNKEEAMCIVK